MADQHLGIKVTADGTQQASNGLKDIGSSAKDASKDLSLLQQTMTNMELAAPMRTVVSNFKKAILNIKDADPRKYLDAWKQAYGQLQDITGADLVSRSMQSLSTALAPQEIMTAMKNIGSEFQRKASIAEAAERKTQQALKETARVAEQTRKALRADIDYSANGGLTKSSILDTRAIQAEKDLINEFKGEINRDANGQGLDLKPHTEEVKDFTKEVGKSNGILSNFWGSLARIAKLRLLRGIIRAVTQAFKEGTENIYYYSQALNSADASHFATTMNELASGFQYLKNSIGAVVAPILSALLPALQTVINTVALALDYLAQFFAVINGQSTYTRAKKQASAWKDVGGAASGAAAAAKEYKNTIMSFDEIHALNDPSSGGGGGGGGASAPGYEDMFEEVELPHNIFTSLGKLFNKDGIVGKALGFFQDIGTFVSESLSPALSYLWGTITGDIEMCNQAYKDLQASVANNSTMQKIIGKAAEVREYIRNAIDDVRLWFWNAVEDVTELLRPLLELMGWDVDDITAKISKQKDEIIKHQAQVYSDTVYMKLWSAGWDESTANAVANTLGLTRQVGLSSVSIVKDMNNAKKSVDNTKDSTYAGKDAWGYYANAVYNAQATKYTGSNVTGGLSDTVWWADYASGRIWNLRNAIDALRAGAVTGVNIAVNVLKNYGFANGGFVGGYANGGIIPRFDGGGINTGQLFIANEGQQPELIANIGNRTAVANQGQMVDMVSDGVYRAVTEAMSSGNSNVEVIVNMDSETVARAVDRGNRSLNRRFSVSLA